MVDILDFERCDILENIESECGRVVAVDTETTGLDPYGKPSEVGVHKARLFYVSFTNGEGLCDSVRFEVNPFTREVDYTSNPDGYKKVKKILEDPTTVKVMHNAPFDITMLQFAGIKTKGKVFDTMIMAHVDSSARPTYALKPLTKMLFNIPDEDQSELKKSVIKIRREGKKKGWALSGDVEGDYFLGDRTLCDVYGCTDTIRTMALYWSYIDRYNEDTTYRSLVDVELEVQRVARKMTKKGITINSDVAYSIKEYYENIIKTSEKEKELLGYSELNTNSSKQMQKVFYEELGEKVIVNKKTGKPSLDAKVLSSISKGNGAGARLANIILSIKASHHELTSFIDPLIELSESDGGVVHPNYRTVGPITGRISCAKPNLMNISSNTSAGKKSEVDYRARECFVPRKDHVLYFPDYSQVEIWLAMFIAKDKFGMTALLDGADMHSILAKKIWGKRSDFNTNKTYRKRAKIAGFGMLYGGGAKALMDLIGCTYEEGAMIREAYLAQYPGIAEMIKSLEVDVQSHGYVVNPFGRKYYVNPDQAYKAFNYMIQGTAAEVMKRAIINTYKLFQETRWNRCNLLLTIHDELGCEIPKNLHSKRLMREVIKAMQGDFHKIIGIPVPLGVGMKYTTTNWAEAKELEEL